MNFVDFCSRTEQKRYFIHDNMKSHVTHKIWRGIPCLGAMAGFMLLALAPCAAHADIYKCRHADGSTEISNKPCPSGSGTVTSRPDEVISEARRREAERDVERMRMQVEQREAQQRTAIGPIPPVPAREPGSENNPNARRSVEDCVRELDRHPLDVEQRKQLAAACQNNPDIQPVIVPAPASIPAPAGFSQSSPVGQCIQAVLNLNIPVQDKQVRIRQCEAAAGGQPLPDSRVQTRPASLPPVNTTQPGPAPRQESRSAPPNVICLPGSKSCGN